MVKPSFKKPGEDIDLRVKTEIDKVRTEFDAKYKVEVEERVKAILKEKDETDIKAKAEKLKQAVDTAKAIKGEKGDKGDSDKDILDCPTCHTEGRSGHMHKLDTDKSGLVYRCNDKGCGFEYAVAPKSADYKCTNCNFPIGKPIDENKKKDMSCPFCGHGKSIRFDWSKLTGVSKIKK